MLPSLTSMCLQKISHQTCLYSNQVIGNVSRSHVSIKAKEFQLPLNSEFPNPVHNKPNKSKDVSYKSPVEKKNETYFDIQDIGISNGSNNMENVLNSTYTGKNFNIIDLKNETDNTSYKSVVGKNDDTDIVLDDTMILSDSGKQTDIVEIKNKIGDIPDVNDNAAIEKESEIDFVMKNNMILSYNIVDTTDEIADISCVNGISSIEKMGKTDFVTENLMNSSNSNKDISSVSAINDHLDEHIEAVRDVVKRYRCQKCDYRAAQSGNLKTHISAVHEVNKPHKCQQCAYSASQACHLRRHILAVHEKEKTKLIKCFKCGYSTYELGNLRMHINGVHEKNTSHKCSECDYRTAFSSNLRRHINNVHKEIKPFKCDKCDYRASEERAVRMHMNAAHEAIKPFQCQKCDFKTSWPSNLRKHKKKVHGGKEDIHLSIM